DDRARVGKASLIGRRGRNDGWIAPRAQGIAIVDLLEIGAAIDVHAHPIDRALQSPIELANFPEFSLISQLEAVMHLVVCVGTARAPGAAHGDEFAICRNLRGVIVTPVPGVTAGIS